MKIASGDFDIEIFEDVNAIQSDWEWLEKEGLLTAFQRRAWLLPFYNVLLPHIGATPVFVLVRNHRSQRPAMLLPLCTRRYHGIAVTEFADAGVSDYNAPILARSFTPSPAQWQALWEKIVAALQQGSILWLKKMPAMIGKQPNPLVQYNKKSAMMNLASWGITLPSTFTKYQHGMLHPSFLKELAKKNRRIRKRGNVEYSITQTQEEKRRVFDILAHQRQARCDEMGRNNILAQPAYRQFYETTVVETQENLASLGVLRVDGEEIATLLALDHNKTMCVIMTTFQGGEWKNCSLGNAIMQSAIEHSINNGITFFDFTIGNEGYKQQFGSSQNALYYAIHPLTATGSSIAWLLNFYLRIRNMVQEYTRPKRFWDKAMQICFPPLSASATSRA